MLWYNAGMSINSLVSNKTALSAHMLIPVTGRNLLNPSPDIATAMLATTVTVKMGHWSAGCGYGATIRRTVDHALHNPDTVPIAADRNGVFGIIVDLVICCYVELPLFWS